MEYIRNVFLLGSILMFLSLIPLSWDIKCLKILNNSKLLNTNLGKPFKKIIFLANMSGKGRGQNTFPPRNVSFFVLGKICLAFSEIFRFKKLIFVCILHINKLTYWLIYLLRHRGGGTKGLSGHFH